MPRRARYEKPFRSPKGMRLAALRRLCLLLTLLPALALPAAAQEGTAYEDCGGIGDTAFRERIEALAREAFGSALRDFDYDAAVEAAWQRQQLSTLIDTQVKAAVEDLYAEESSLDIALSGLDPGTAEDYAAFVAERAFASPAFERGLEALSADVGEQLLEASVTASGSFAVSAERCIAAFVDERYPEIVREAFTARLAASVDLKGARGGEGDLAAALNVAGVVAGVLLLIGRRVVGRVVALVVRRITGQLAARVAARLVPLLGAALLAIDAFTIWDGVLPTLQEEFSSPAIKAEIRGEIAGAFRREMTGAIPQIAAQAATEVNEAWLQFQRDNRSVLALAESKPRFAAFMGKYQGETFPLMVRVVGLLQRRGGEEAVLQALDRGQLDEAMTLSPAALQIAEALRRLPPALAWQRAAPAEIEKVYRSGLYETKDADDLPPPLLRPLLARDLPAIRRLAPLPVAPLSGLLALQPATLERALLVLTDRDLERLGTILAEVAGQGLRQEIALLVLNDPKKLEAIEPLVGPLKEADEPIARLKDWVSPPNLLNVTALLSDTEALLRAEMPLSLYWERHKLVSIVAIVLALPMILIVLRFLFFCYRIALPSRRPAR